LAGPPPKKKTGGGGRRRPNKRGGPQRTGTPEGGRGPKKKRGGVRKGLRIWLGKRGGGEHGAPPGEFFPSAATTMLGFDGRGPEKKLPPTKRAPFVDRFDWGPFGGGQLVPRGRGGFPQVSGDGPRKTRWPGKFVKKRQ